MSDFQKKLEEMKAKQEQALQAVKNEFAAFVQANYPEAKSTDSGLYYIMEDEGFGPKPSKFQNVSVHYTGMLTDGSVFDTSHKRGQPIAFPIGAGRVIKGWDEGIALLGIGGKAKLIIPYFLAYGDAGRPPVIPAKATLIFDVELVGIG